MSRQDGAVESAAGANRPADAPSTVRAGEAVLFKTRSAPAGVLLSNVGFIVMAVIVGGGAAYAAALAGWVGLAARIAGGAVLVVLLRLAWSAIERRAAEYLLTDRRAVWSGGVLGRYTVECPLDRVHQISVAQGLMERVVGVGTVRVRSGAEGGPPVVWRWIAEPVRVAERVREAAAEYAGARLGPERSGGRVGGARWAGQDGKARPVMPASYSQPDTDGAASMPIIGLAGGIGAGKSTVAAAFRSLGCYVIDSDQRVRAALDRADVRERLVEWWGAEVLDGAGRVDRAKVASIIFGAPAERARLEQLVHPLVRQDRAAMIDEAARTWAKAAIVDAPLLFEAGVDAECDCVVFVDTPRAERVERVRSSRGWTDEELARREAAQMNLDDKRARCRFVIDNSAAGTTARPVREQAREVLEAVRAMVRGGAGREG